MCNRVIWVVHDSTKSVSFQLRACVKRVLCELCEKKFANHEPEHKNHPRTTRTKNDIIIIFCRFHVIALYFFVRSCNMWWTISRAFFIRCKALLEQPPISRFYSYMFCNGVSGHRRKSRRTIENNVFRPLDFQSIRKKRRRPFSIYSLFYAHRRDISGLVLGQNLNTSFFQIGSAARSLSLSSLFYW